uniref:Uncharacterized protein n=1 Tax=Salix viminalis TaxID=40686 RepID=A0A6N2LGT1_SALVM
MVDNENPEYDTRALRDFALPQDFLVVYPSACWLVGQLEPPNFELKLVNEEIEANIQITREILSDTVKCTELEAALAAIKKGPH